MNVTKVKRLCTVKGCKNTDSYAISRSGEMGGVIICESCLKEALKGVKELSKTGAAKVSTEKPPQAPDVPLFFHPEIKSDLSGPSEPEPEPDKTPSKPDPEPVSD